MSVSADNALAAVASLDHGAPGAEHAASAGSAVANTPDAEAAASPITDLPRDVLAKAFIAQLRREAGIMPRPRSGELDPELAAFLADLPQDEEEGPKLRADRALVAVLLARAFGDGHMGLIRTIKTGAPVVQVAVSNPDLVTVVRSVFQICVLGSNRKIIEGSTRLGGDSRSVLGVFREESEKRKINDELAWAIDRNVPILAVAPDPKRHLPRELLRMVTHKIALPAIDATAVHRVIEAVIGAEPTRLLAADLVKLVDMEDFPLVLRGSDPDVALDALETLLKRKLEVDEDGPSLSDLSGYGEARDWGLALADDLAGFRSGTVKWDEVDGRGLLLSGPPGTGKTSFARALAKSCRVPLVATSVAQWNAGDHLGSTLQAIQDVFRRARRLAPSILFVDELDGISDRAKLDNRHVEYWSQIVNLFLEELQGIEQREGVVVVGASNHPDRIDPAVRRSGRLDREIRIELPKPQDLARILRFHLGQDILPDTDLMPAAIRMVGRSGADAEAFVRRAKAAARRAKRPVHLDDLLAEIRGKNTQVVPESRRIIAVHEAGHAVVARATGRNIAWLGFTERGGATEMLPQPGLMGLADLEDVLAIDMAGMAAEEIILGRITTGAGGSPQSDIARSTDLARQIETAYGLGRFGPVDLGDGVLKEPIWAFPELHAAVTERLDGCLARAREIIREHQQLVEAVAERMTADGFISGEAFAAIADDHGLALGHLSTTARAKG